MLGPRSQRRGGGWWAVALAAALLTLLAAAAADAVPAGDAAVTVDAAPEAFGTDTAIGRIAYHPGRGLRLGKTGLVLGGYATVEAERLEGGESRGGIEGVNFLAFLDPVPFLHLFTDVEVERIVAWSSDQEGAVSDLDVEVERLFLDLRARDALNVRFGKFLTPFGRWNLTPIEPLTWTTSEPLLVEEVFDETTTGAMLFGTAFPGTAAVSYSLYGSFLDPIAPDREQPPAEHTVGAHLEWASLRGWSVGASYLASEIEDGEWNHLGGIDALWQPHRRVEVTGEALAGEGSQEQGAVWGLYAQVVVETLPTLYAVGRYEHFDPANARPIDLFDVGLAWVPLPSLRFKVDYQFATHLDEPAELGFRASFSVLF